MIDIETYHGSHFTFEINGNGGENQLIVMLSPAQNGCSPVLIAAVSVDGGLDILTHARWIAMNDLYSFIEGVIQEWSVRGVKPNGVQAENIEAQIQGVMIDLAKHYHLPLPNKSVYEYYYDKFGLYPEDETLKELPLDSGCGDPCKQVIDRAASLLEAADPSLDVRDPILQGVEKSLSIFWHG